MLQPIKQNTQYETTKYNRKNSPINSNNLRHRHLRRCRCNPFKFIIMIHNKLNKFEAGVIEDALNLWCDTFIQEIDERESNGSVALFHPDFPKGIKADILDKVRDLTKKR